MTTLQKALACVVLIFSSGQHLLASAQEVPIELRGGWTATAGVNRTFTGAWTAQLSPDKPNSAEGSWTLINEAGQITLEGTWAANKTRFGWQGAWSARTLTGQLFSGTWTADIAGSNGKTLRQMLEWTLEKDILGSWRSGRYQGGWRLKGTPQAGHGR